MSNIETESQELCPKRLWVLTTLSDDEAVSGDERMPQGLAFHLSRCEYCRALASTLESVTLGLDQLRDSEPPDNLSFVAEQRVLAAIRDGGVLTGRFAIDDEPPVSISRPARRVHFKLTVPRFAAAAAIIVVVGLVGMRTLSVKNRNFTDQAGPWLVGGSSAPGSVQHGSVTTETKAPGAVSSTEQQVAELERPAKVNRFRSHEEVLENDDQTGATAAVVIPDSADRGVGWLMWFDNRPKNRLKHGTQNDNAP